MSSNNDDKSEKKNLNINTDNSLFKPDFFEKQNIKTQKNKLTTKKTESFQQKDKDSIFSGSSNENENNNSSEDNKDQNDNNYLVPKDIIDINDPGEKTSPKKDKNNINDNMINNLMSINNNEKNQKEKEENQNISRSMSSKSNLSRSRSRSQSEKNSPSDDQNKNFESQNQEKNNKNLGNKFKNYKNSRRQRNTNNNKNNNNSSFIMKNGCCRNCMKAFSKNGKSCLCQVPRRERKFILPETGCNYCGCHGCNPIDMKYNKRLQQKNLLFQDNSINHKNQRILDSEDEDLKINDDLIDYYNRDKKDIQENLSDMLKINSIFYGFGVPLRIPSYILGYNPNVNYYYEKKNLGNNNYLDNNYMGGIMNNNNMNNMNNNMGNNMNNYNYDLNMNNNRYRRNNNYNNNNNNFSSYGNNLGSNNFQNNMNNNMNFNRNQRFRK